MGFAFVDVLGLRGVLLMALNADRPLLVATISLPEDRRGKDYSDYDFRTERFLLKFCIWR
jgi:hypothetical protein